MGETNTRTDGNHGVALLGVLVILALLTALGTMLFVAVNLDAQLQGAFSRNLKGFYAAEAGLNKGMGEFKNIFLNFNVPGPSDLAPKTYEIGNRLVDYQLVERPGNPIERTIPPGQLFAGLNTSEYVYRVTSSASPSRGGSGSSGALKDIEASVGAEFRVGNIPVFQFVAFYKDDLEILPGPDMHLVGRVHTNGDLYLNSNKHLFVEDDPDHNVFSVQVSARGDIYRGRKNNNSCGGHVIVDKLEDSEPDGDLDPKELSCGAGGRAKISEDTLALWKGSLVDHIETISVPEPDIIKRGSGTFWQDADLRIVLKLNTPGRIRGGPILPHSIEVQKADGTPDVLQTTALVQFMSDAAWNAANSSMPGTVPIYYSDVPTGVTPCTCTDANVDNCNNNRAVCYSPQFALGNDRVYSSDMGTGVGNFDLDYRRGGYYNWREKKWIYLLNINVADLIAWNGSHNEPFFSNMDRSDGGLVIFASVEGPDSGTTNNYGARIFGSANLPIPVDPNNTDDPTGLTVVTDQAAYVAGNYNDGSALPKQPAAVIGDSLNVLSSAWFRTNCTGDCAYNDRQVGFSSLGNRTAADTIINSAFLAGVDLTGGANGAAGQGGKYNGGLENYPRFHERWSGRTLTYVGSFVSLGTPSHVNGRWSYGGSVYTAPGRNWSFDTDFADVANIPPHTPRFVYVQQVLFTQNFQ